MKRKVLLIFISILSKFLVSADIPFNFTIVPGVSLFMQDETTNLSTGFISSEVYELDGIQLGPIYTVSSKEANGVQAAGVFNIAAEEGLLIQLAGVMNVADRLEGIQFGGVINISDNLDGIQGGGVVSVAADVDGVQMSGVINIAENMDGVQLGGVINVSEDFRGLQAAGVINVAESVDGAQIGGVINVAESGKNFQLGVINIVAGDSGDSTPLGLINFYEDGIFDISCWMDSSDRIYQSFKSGSNNLYTEFYTGSMDWDFTTVEDRVIGTALGFRKGERNLHIDSTVGAMFMFDQGYNHLWIPEVKTQLGLSFGPLSIFGGVSGKLAIKDYSDNVDFLSDSVYIEISETVDMYTNLFAGFSIEL